MFAQDVRIGHKLEMKGIPELPGKAQGGSAERKCRRVGICRRVGSKMNIGPISPISLMALIGLKNFRYSSSAFGLAIPSFCILD